MTLELIKERNLVLELIQENLIEFLAQYIYFYILISDGPYLAIFSLF